MAGHLSFDGRVAVVTGAGGGLGRQYALLLAKRGASVVVNDLGGSFKGEGQSRSAADLVVEEIKAQGGKAVANYDPVQEGDKIIKTAIDAFGRIDILINNAGILRDRSFLKMADNDWDLIHQVHLVGAFKVTRAAWPYMRQQKYGRIIMTASGAGIFGNFGQTNYSSAKMALIGLSNSLAIEGAKYGIHSNVIVPIAASRMTEDIIPPDLFAKLKPDFVAPVVSWLCHDDCEDNGNIYQAAGGWVGKYKWQRSTGVALPANEQMTIEMVKRYWDDINNMEDASLPASIQEDIGLVATALADPVDVSEPAVGNNDGGFDVELAVKTKFKTVATKYEAKDAILYALGVGCKQNGQDLKFVYEGHEKFSVLPSFAVIQAQASMVDSGLFLGKIPGLPVDLSKVLHGEQYLQVFQPLPTSGTFKSVMKIADVIDKGSGAVVIADFDTFDSSGNLIAKNQFSIFLVGSGGFGGKRNSPKLVPIVNPPNRTCDATAKTKTDESLPATYRLSGDLNPLHIDPDFAALGGFPKPILHGLCSFGIVTRQVLEKFAGDDVAKFKAIKARFGKPIFPGETIETQMWREGNRIFVQSKACERGNIVLTGYVDLTDVSADAAPTQTAPQSTGQNLKSEAVFKELAHRVSATPALVNQIKGIFEWVILRGGKPAQTWTVDLKNAPGSVYEGSAKTKSDVTLTLEDDIMVDIVSGKLNPQKAFMTKKLAIKGNIMLTQKLQKLFQANAKL